MNTGFEKIRAINPDSLSLNGVDKVLTYLILTL